MAVPPGQAFNALKETCPTWKYIHGFLWGTQQNVKAFFIYLLFIYSIRSFSQNANVNNFVCYVKTRL